MVPRLCLRYLVESDTLALLRFTRQLCRQGVVTAQRSAIALT